MIGAAVETASRADDAVILLLVVTFLFAGFGFLAFVVEQYERRLERRERRNDGYSD